MYYQAQFESFINEAFRRAGLGGRKASLWPQSASVEGVQYGQFEDLPAREAAAFCLAAGSMIRMSEGALPIPLASRLIHASRWLAAELCLGDQLIEALDRVEDDRVDWISEHRAQHEESFFPPVEHPETIH